MFVYKHKEIIEYIKKLAYFLRKCKFYGWITLTNSYEISGCYFYTNSNIWGDFQICIGVPLRKRSVISTCSGQV